MAAEKEPEDVVIQGRVGPYANQRLTVPAAVAKAAIKDGWAIDPFAPPSDEPPAEFDHEKALAAAEAAARKLRGEDQQAEGEAKQAENDDEPASTPKRRR